MTYATDGKCHNAEPGTFGHECGKPAEFIGTKANGFQSGFCADCAEHGFERHGYTMRPAKIEPSLDPLFDFLVACDAHPYD